MSHYLYRCPICFADRTHKFMFLTDTWVLSSWLKALTSIFCTSVRWKIVLNSISSLPLQTLSRLDLISFFNIQLLNLDLKLVVLEILIMLFTLGDGSAAADIGWHSSSWPSAARLGPTEAHSAAGGVQPGGQEDRQHSSAAGCVPVHFNHAEEPQSLGE